MFRRLVGCGLAAAAIFGFLASTSHSEVPQGQATRATVRSSSHNGFGRVAINADEKTDFQLDQDGDHVIVRFSDEVALGRPPAAPRNVVAVQTDGSDLELTLRHDATIHATRKSGLVIFDIMDPKPKAPAPAGSHDSKNQPEAKSDPPPAVVPAVSPASPPPVSVAAPPVTETPTLTDKIAQPLPIVPTATPAPASAAEHSLPEAVQQTTPGRDVLPENEAPAGLMARRVALPKDMDGSAFRVPFDSTTGAAAFRKGNIAYIIFAERRPVDMSALQNDPVFGAATVQLLPNGTLFRVPLSPTRWIALTQMPQGWRIAALSTALKQQPIAVSQTNGRLNLAVEQPGNIVSLADPDTGATLLVGTQRRPGQGMAVTRQSSEFILSPTTQGVVVEPLSDVITLRQVPTGFVLVGGPGGLLLSPPTSETALLMDAAHLSQRFNFSNEPADALLANANKEIAAAAASPPLARSVENHQAAKNFLALGLGVEAESLLQIAAEQDPKEAASAESGALIAIAALLAGRKEEAEGLLDPRLDGTDEIMLWRAIRQAMLDDGSPAAAAVFSATAPLVFTYPAGIREHVLPLIAETMIKGGEVAPAAHLLNEAKNNPGLGYARALMQQAEGNTDQALHLLDALATGHDQFDRARASTHAVELRLAAGKLNKSQAADALDKLLYSWRGDGRELALREQVAELRGQTGMWHEALSILRQAETDFPDQAKSIHKRLKDTFVAMIRDPAEQQVSPIDFVSTVGDNTDLLPDGGEDGEAVEQSLASRLLALDLPSRARPVLDKLMRSAQSDVARARFGATLATLEARESNDAGVQEVLNRSEGHDLPPDLVEQRLILRANAVAHFGDPAAGAALLEPLRTSHAVQTRAQILEAASDWAGAEHAWSDCVALTLPDSGMINEAQTQTMLRLATATARAGDNAGLAELRAKYTNRIGPGPSADMFRLLTAEPITTSADIKRSQQEMGLAASLQGSLNASQNAAAPP